MNRERDNTMKSQENHKSIDYMLEALKEAKKAYAIDEVPVGAVVVYNNEIISRAHNTRSSNNLFYGHAEFLALMKASKVIGDWRLEECDVYVTLEPCAMCAGAMIQSRIRSLYYGALDPKAGAIESKVNLLEVEFNHKIKTYGSIHAHDSSQLLKSFFKNKRNK
jgi:tRNA(adenine34) deaminase